MMDNKEMVISEPLCIRLQCGIDSPNKVTVKPVHTLADWKDGKAVPFNLYHRPKEIIHTHPREKPTKYEKLIDTGRELAQKTRPRLVLTPAISIDDVENSQDRNIICNYIYKSEYRSAYTYSN